MRGGRIYLLPRVRFRAACHSRLFYIVKGSLLVAGLSFGGLLKKTKAVDPVAVLLVALAERWDGFVREVTRCRRRPTEPAIHDLRVATRRLLAAMTTVDSLLPGNRFKRPSSELRKHLKSFNVVRDVHVQLLALRGLRGRFPVVRQYERFLRKQERTLVRAVQTELRSIRQDMLLRSIAGVHAAMSGFYGAPALSGAVRAMLVGRAAFTFARVLARRAALSPANSRSVHRLRVAFKKFRYSVELARPVLPWADKEHGRVMDAFQTAMGEIQDLEVLLAGIQRFAQHDARSAGRLSLPVLQFLGSVRTTKRNNFLHAADDVQKFWG
jgi:CHAD domain-containing protein